MQTMANYLSHKLKMFIALFIIVQIATWLVSNYIFTIPIQSDIVKNIGINFGIGLGATLTTYICYLWLLSAYEESRKSVNTMVPVTMGIILTLLALPFGMMIGIIGGGTLGGGYMSILFEWLGFNQRIGVSLGVGLGIFIVSVIPTLLATIVGFSVGKVLTRPLESAK
jgi:hypothetical protein